MVRRGIVVALMTIGMLAPMGAALADPIEVGPCNHPDSIVIRVGQTAKVCVRP